MNHPKLIDGVLTGKDLPPHLARAYGRSIFKLMHTSTVPRTVLWLRDLPMNLFDLEYAGQNIPLIAYRAECDRANIPAESRVGA